MSDSQTRLGVLLLTLEGYHWGTHTLFDITMGGFPKLYVLACIKIPKTFRPNTAKHFLKYGISKSIERWISFLAGWRPTVSSENSDNAVSLRRLWLLGAALCFKTKRTWQTTCCQTSVSEPRALLTIQISCMSKNRNTVIVLKCWQNTSQEQGP